MIKTKSSNPKADKLHRAICTMLDNAMIPCEQYKLDVKWGKNRSAAQLGQSIENISKYQIEPTATKWEKLTGKIFDEKKYK